MRSGVVSGLSVLALACGGDSGTGPTLDGGSDGGGAGGRPLQIIETSPGAGATAVEVGARILANFNNSIDPATLTPASFSIALNGAPLSVGVFHDAAAHTAWLSSPLLPGTSYEVRVDTTLRGGTRQRLPQAHSWSFSTRPWQNVTLVNYRGGYASLADEAGTASGLGDRLHLLYAGGVTFIAGSALAYSTCVSSCTDVGSWQTVAVDTVAHPASVSLAIESSRRLAPQLHVSYSDAVHHDLLYATCTSPCTATANWTIVRVDTVGSVGQYASLRIDRTGSLHLVYYDSDNRALKYATCSAGCSSPAGWGRLFLDRTADVGQYASLALGPNGELHVSYYDATAHDLKYATCSLFCTISTNWLITTVDAGPSDVGETTSLAMDGAGRVHLAYYDRSNLVLKYATCSAGCVNPVSWDTATVGPAGALGAYPSLAADGDGRVHVSYGGPGALWYGTCAADCGRPSAWQRIEVDRNVLAVASTSLSLGRGGRVRVSYVAGAFSSGALRFVE